MYLLVGFVEEINAPAGLIELGGLLVCLLRKVGLSGSRSLEVHVKRAKQFFDIDVGEVFDVVAGVDVMAEVGCVLGLNVVLLALLVGPLQEGDQTARTDDDPANELDDLEVTQVLVLLDSDANGLRDAAHLDKQP